MKLYLASGNAHKAREFQALADAGALPVVIGGDHSVNIPCIHAFAGRGPIHILQIDALDVAGHAGILAIGQRGDVADG